MNQERIAPFTEYLMADCWHRNLYTPQEALDARVEDQINPHTGQKEIALACRACNNGERGFCHNSVTHRVMAMTPKFSHYSRDVKTPPSPPLTTSQQQQQQQKEQQQKEQT